jgi:hypothetical protein
VHLSPSLTEHKKNTTAYDVGNPGPGLRQAQKYGRVLIYFATTFCRVKVQEKGHFLFIIYIKSECTLCMLLIYLLMVVKLTLMGGVFYEGNK